MGINKALSHISSIDIEYKKLGDIITFLNGRAYKQTELLSEGKYKVVRVGNFFTNDKWYYSDLELEDNKYCNYGDLLYCWAASLGPQIWDGEKTIFHYHIWKLEFDESIINKRYLYHFLKKDVDCIYNSLTQSTMPHVSMASMKERIIPVPPIEVQAEIVKILDEYTESVTALQQELEKELTARKKQYEYYRELILDKNTEVMWVPLLDVAETYTGLTYRPADTAKSGTIVLRSSNIKSSKLVFDDNVYVQMSNIPQRAIVQESDILICVRNGSKALIGKAAMIPKTKEKMAFGAFMTILRPNNKINPKYLFFVWQSPRIQNMIHGDSGMPINQITKSMLEKIQVPLPSLKAQENIVSILERFDKLCNDISEGLPAEIEARRKQYEYYRDKLLSFK